MPPCESNPAQRQTQAILMPVLAVQAVKPADMGPLNFAEIPDDG
jgi:hypothetical protein